MAVTFHLSGRGVEVGPTLRRRVEAKIAKFTRVLPKITEARVVLGQERYRHLAEVTLQAKGTTLRSEAAAGDFQAAVDLALESLGRQVLRRKDRITARKPRPSRPGPKRARPPAASSEPPVDDEPSLAVRRITAKPMSVDEALEQFRVTGRDLLLFTNARSRAVNVLRRRPDGSLELVEPGG
jgi:ribosome hibernation promoting factor